jgi:hypothetical protein
MHRGVPPVRIVLAAGAVMALLAASAFALAPNLPAAFALALLASGVGGAVPASLFATVPRTVPEPALIGPAMGLTIQANNLGQIVTPPVVAMAAGQSWALVAVPLLLAGAALLALARPLHAGR